MAELPEIPEAKDPFEKRVALTIAILAIFLSFVENLGDNAKTDAIIKTNEASNQWGYYQAKSIKGQLTEIHGDMVSRFAKTAPAEPGAVTAEALKQEAERYGGEKAEIKANAEKLQKEAAHQTSVNDRCDQGSLFLQIALVICSVAILAGSHKFWFAGLALGACGVIVGLSAFFL